MEKRFEAMAEKAKQMASSGQYSDWLEIELELRRIGFREARQWLKSVPVRAELDRLCRAHPLRDAA